MSLSTEPFLPRFLEPVLLDAVTTSQGSPVQIDDHEPPLSAPLKLSFDYTRSVGPTLSQFFTALRERRIVGNRGSDGRVHVPPAEYDPVTYEQLTEIVPVASVGTVVSWTWQPEPLEGQPLDRPFAWALIKLDGADTPMVHAVDTGGDPDKVRAGSRVQAKWRPARPAPTGDEGEGDTKREPKEPHVYREGHILDIECFVLEGSAA